MRKKVVTAFSYIKQVFKEFSGDDILKYSASLAYYTVFSLAPVLIVIISISGFLLGKEAIQGHVYGQIIGLVGENAAEQVQDIIKNIHLTGHSFFCKRN